MVMIMTTMMQAMCMATIAIIIGQAMGITAIPMPCLTVID